MVLFKVIEAIKSSETDVESMPENIKGGKKTEKNAEEVLITKENHIQITVIEITTLPFSIMNWE